MSNWIDREEFSLDMLRDLMEAAFGTVEIDEDSVIVTNENNLQIYVSLDEDDGVINWFCATKLNDGTDELAISRACKVLNDEEGLPCCNLSYDINEVHGIYAGGSMQLSCERGVALETLIETHRKFENSCVRMFLTLSEQGFLELEE